MKTLIAKYGSAIGMIVAGLLLFAVGQGILTEESASNIVAGIMAITGGAVVVSKSGNRPSSF